MKNKDNKRTLSNLVFMICATVLCAQFATQTTRDIVTDKNTKQLLAVAAVRILQPNLSETRNPTSEIGTVTDSADN